MRSTPTRIMVSLTSALLMGLATLPAAADTAYEKPPVLKARDLVPGGQLEGARYQIDPTVPTDGFLMKFTVRSDFGTFQPRSPERLRNCLVEIAALEQLEKISESDAFADGLKKSAKDLGTDVKNLVTEPKETLEGLGEGVGRFFKRTYRAAKTGTQKLGDMAAHDEDQPTPRGPGANLPGGVDPTAGSQEGDLVTAGAAMAGKTTVDIFGYDEQRRALAKKLKVDPYTTNKVLREKLDDVAWAAFAGGLGITALKMATPASIALSAGTTASSWVWDTPPGDLKVFNEKTLLNMGVEQDSVDRLLRSRWYNLTLQSRFVRALDRLSGVTGRPRVMELALTVESEAQARFVTEALEMLADYHQKSTPIAEIEVLGSVVGRTKEGKIVVPAPVDYVSWTEPLGKFATRKDLAGKQRLILLRGRLTPLAKQELERLGWQVREGVTG